MNKEQWGSHDCIHAKACRRLNKKAFAQLGRRVVMGCDKDTCTAYESESGVYSYEEVERIYYNLKERMMYGESPDDLIFRG